MADRVFKILLTVLLMLDGIYLALPTAQVEFTVPKCDSGWTNNPLSPYCYMINETAASWQDARVTCQRHDAELASITSYQEKAFIIGTVGSDSETRMWLGLNDLETANVWRWSNGDPMVFFNWAGGAPPRTPGDCGAFTMSTSYWNSTQCNTPLGHLCKKRGAAPTRPPTVMTTPNVPPGYRFGCLGDWTEWRGRCYQIVRHTDMSWEGARDACRRIGGDLASIADQDEQNFIAAQARDKIPGPLIYDNGLWIGLHERKNKGMYEWSDDSEVTYTNWDPYEPNNFEGLAEDCVGMYIRSGGWNDKECGDDGNSKGYVCKAPRRVIAGTDLPPTQAGCPSGWNHAYQRHCYSFEKNPQNWENARTQCTSKQGELVDILDRFEQGYISSVLATERGQYWIGVSNRGNADKSYTWSSGSRVEYTNWYRDFTGNEENKCVSISTGRPAGLWRPMECAESFSFICKRFKEGISSTILTTTPAPIPCPSDWKEHNGYCYIAFKESDGRKKRTWMEARDDCRARGGDLASIHDEEENSHIATLQSRWGGGGNVYWIGLNHRDQDLGERWNDGSGANYRKWDSEQPDRMDGRLNCVTFDASWSNEKWKYDNCGLPKNWICKAQKGSIVTPPPPPTANTSPSCGLDTEWRHYNSYCYYPSKSSETKTWQDARHYCMQRGGDLASVHSWEENTFVAAMIVREGFTAKAWFGLNELEEIGTYKWSDGTAADALYWNPGEPNDHGHGQRCCNFYPWNGLWNDDNCAESLRFICKKLNGTAVTKTTVPAPTVPGYCPAGFFGIGNKCLGLFGTGDGEQLNFEAAVQECRAKGGVRPDIASINSPEESALLTSFLVPNTKSYYIGFNSISVRSTWVWVDNHDVVYTRWGLGEPSNEWSDRCTEVWTPDDKIGTWNDINCNTQRGYVCQTFKDASAVVNTPASMPPNGQNCRDGYLPYGTACYKRQVVKQSWQAAKESCQNEGAELASIHSLPENSAVFYFTSMQSQEQVWIGLNDLENKGTYVWTDNWPVTFAHWGNNEPSDGEEGTGCVAMNARGRWNNTLCNQQLSSICKTTSLPPPTIPPIPPGRCQNENWIKYGGNCYNMEQVMAYETWPNARFECQQQGSALISIHSQQENDWVQENFESRQTYRRDVWLGMLKRGQNLDYYWDDGSPVGFTNWAPGNPRDTAGWDCVSMTRNGKWQNEGCRINNAYACKTPVELPKTTMKITEPPSTTTTSQSSSSSELPKTTMKITEPPSTTRTSQSSSSSSGSTYITRRARPPTQPTPAGAQGGGLSVGGRVGVALAVIAVVTGVAVGVVIFLYKRRRGVATFGRSRFDNKTEDDKIHFEGFENPDYQSSA